MHQTLPTLAPAPPSSARQAHLLVQQGMLVGHYDDADLTSAERAAVRLERVCACPVAIYRATLTPEARPRPGSQVDPARLGWLRVS